MACVGKAITMKSPCICDPIHEAPLVSKPIVMELDVEAVSAVAVNALADPVDPCGMGSNGDNQLQTCVYHNGSQLSHLSH